MALLTAVLLIVSCDLNKMDEELPQPLPPEPSMVYIDWDVPPSAKASYEISSSDAGVDALLPGEPRSDSLVLSNLPAGTELSFRFTADHSAPSYRITGFCIEPASDTDTVKSVRTEANEDETVFTAKWKTTSRNEAVRIVPVYRVTVEIEESFYGGKIVTDTGMEKPFSASYDRQTLELEMLDDYKFVLDGVENVGFDTISRHEIFYQHTTGGKSYTLVDYDDTQRFSIDPFTKNGKEIFSIQRKNIRQVILTAPKDFDLQYTIPNSPTIGFAVRRGTSRFVPLPWDRSITVTVVDPESLISSVNWGENLPQVKNSTIQVSYEDACLVKEIVPEPVLSEFIVKIVEPEKELFLTVYDENGTKIEGVFDVAGGYTVYKRPVGARITMKVMDPEGYYFSYWGENKEDIALEKTITLHLNDTMITPVFIREELIPGVIYVESRPVSDLRPETVSEAMLGSEANPYRSLREAYASARSGDEIRLLSGEHVLDGPLELDKGITITGGWVQGKGRTLFRYRSNGKGAPTNLISSVTVHYEGEDPWPGQFNIVIPEDNKEPVKIDGVLMVFDENSTYPPEWYGIFAENLTDLELTNSEIQMKSHLGCPTGISSMGRLEMTNCSIDIFEGLATLGVNMQNKEGGILIMDRCRVRVGSDSVWGAQGVNTLSSSSETLIRDNEITARTGSLNMNRPLAGRMLCTALSLSKGKAVGNTIEAVSTAENGFSYAMGLTTSENAGDLIIEDNIFLGSSGSGNESQSAAFINIKEGRVFFGNNIVRFSNTETATTVLKTRATDLVLLGNFFQSDSMKAGSRCVVIDGGCAMAVSNTFQINGSVGDDRPVACIDTVSQTAGSDHAPMIIANNMFAFGPGVGGAIGAVLKEDPRNYMETNVFLDMKAAEGSFSGPDWFGQPVEYSWKSTPVAVSTDAGWVGLGIKELGGSGAIRAEGNFGEGPGDDMPGYFSNMTGLDTSDFTPMLETDIREIAGGGFLYDQFEIDGFVSMIGLKVPSIEHDYMPIKVDINGYMRLPVMAVGAVQPRH